MKPGKYETVILR